MTYPHTFAPCTVKIQPTTVPIALSTYVARVEYFAANIRPSTPTTLKVDEDTMQVDEYQGHYECEEMERLLGYAAMAEQVRPSSGAIMPHQVQTLHTCSLDDTGHALHKMSVFELRGILEAASQSKGAHYFILEIPTGCHL